MPGRSLSRRTAVGSALVAPLVVAACDIDPPSRDNGSAEAAPPPPEDSELVAAVVAAWSAPVRRGRRDALGPRPDARLTGGDRARRAPRRAGGRRADADVPTPPPPRVPADRAGALAAVRRSEQRLLREVRAGCVAAASGDLARVLASMAASTSQHGAALATPEPGTS